MITSGRIWDISDVASWLALTPTERWSAARRVNPTFVSGYGLIMLAGLILLLLMVLLWWVSFGRKPQQVAARGDLFSEYAARRQLTVRECQILRAVVARSDLRDDHHVFTKPDAFDEAARRLLAECVATRTPRESERFKGEMVRLSDKLGFRLVLNQSERRGPAGRRDVPHVSVNGPALVASFPLLANASMALDSDTSPLDAPTFVQGTVVDLVGRVLQIRVGLDVQRGDRTLVVFGPVRTSPLRQGDGTPMRGRIIQSVGEVRDCGETVDGRMVAVELTGLSDSEVDELVATLDVTSRLDVQGPVAPDDHRGPQPAADSRVVQGA